MTTCTRPVRRETHGTIFECGKHRPVIVSIEPPNVIGLRLKGTRRTYFLTSEVAYMVALRAHLAALKKEKARAKKKARRQ